VGSSTYIVRYLFALRNPLYIVLASNYKTRSTRMVMVMVIILAVTSRRRRRQKRRVTAAVPPTVTTRMTMMTTTTIKLVITIKVYNLPNDVSFLLPMMVPL
jgi:ABC-type xylose transport system permease subunit